MNEPSFLNDIIYGLNETLVLKNKDSWLALFFSCLGDESVTLVGNQVIAEVRTCENPSVIPGNMVMSPLKTVNFPNI